MKGSDVKRFQRAVGIREDGYFGDDSEAAAKKLQEENKIESDGFVGPQTWPIVNNIIQAMTQTPDYKALYEAAKAELDAAKLKIAGLTQDLAATNNLLVVEQNTSASWAADSAGKKAELIEVAEAYRTLAKLAGKY
jgi:hypothetical protein